MSRSPCTLCHGTGAKEDVREASPGVVTGVHGQRALREVSGTPRQLAQGQGAVSPLPAYRAGSTVRRRGGGRSGCWGPAQAGARCASCVAGSRLAQRSPRGASPAFGPGVGIRSSLRRARGTASRAPAVPRAPFLYVGLLGLGGRVSAVRAESKVMAVTDHLWESRPSIVDEEPCVHCSTARRIEFRALPGTWLGNGADSWTTIPVERNPGSSRSSTSASRRVMAVTTARTKPSPTILRSSVS